MIEVGVPQLQRLPPGETVRAFSLTPSHLGFDEFDVANQGLISHHYELVDGVWRAHSIPFRYVWPSELDLMARLAGMTLVERWDGWRREPFTRDSTSHISVWRRREQRAPQRLGDRQRCCGCRAIAFAWLQHSRRAPISDGTRSRRRRATAATHETSTPFSAPWTCAFRRKH